LNQKTRNQPQVIVLSTIIDLRCELEVFEFENVKNRLGLVLISGLGWGWIKSKLCLQLYLWIYFKVQQILYWPK